MSSFFTQGREFYACAKPRESGCGHFQWADEVDNGGASGSGYGSGTKFIAVQQNFFVNGLYLFGSVKNLNSVI